MIVYLAGPIDFNKSGVVQEHRHQIKEYFKQYGRAWVYDPSRAWAGGPLPDQFVHWANLQVLEQADLLVAILVRNTLTVGTVLEIQHARERDIPVIVVGDVSDVSISLAALDVEVYESVAEFDDFYIAEIDDLASLNEPVERRECECLAVHAADADCNCAY